MSDETTKKVPAMREWEGVITSVTEDTHDTVTLKIFTGVKEMPYQAGQFISIDPKQFPEILHVAHYLEKLKGRRELRRSYSLSSSPYEDELSITVKAETYVEGETPYPPLLSPFIRYGLAPGRRIKFHGFAGHYVIPPDALEHTDHAVHLVSGSGAVPNFSIIKQDLRFGKMRHTMLCSNKTLGDVLFRQTLTDLQARFPGRLRVDHFLTREPHELTCLTGYHRGRITVDRITERVPDHDKALFYVCGAALTPREKREAAAKGIELSPRFVESMLDALDKLGVSHDRVRKESW